MRYGFIVMVLITFAFADTYQENILNIHAKIFPKIILTDVNIKQKQLKNKIKILIVYRDEESRNAHYLKKKILEAYPFLEQYSLDVGLVTYDTFDDHCDASVYYLLCAKPDEIQKIVNFAQENGRLTFAYERSYLDYGVSIALDVGKKVVPYINLESLKKSNITLENFIYQVAKVR
jgi:hypothetical protein